MFIKYIMTRRKNKINKVIQTKKNKKRKMKRIGGSDKPPLPPRPTTYLQKYIQTQTRSNADAEELQVILQKKLQRNIYITRHSFSCNNDGLGKYKYVLGKDTEPSLSERGILHSLSLKYRNTKFVEMKQPYMKLPSKEETVFVSVLLRTWCTAFLLYGLYFDFETADKKKYSIKTVDTLNLIISPYLKEDGKFTVSIKNEDRDWTDDGNKKYVAEGRRNELISRGNTSKLFSRTIKKFIFFIHHIINKYNVNVSNFKIHLYNYSHAKFNTNGIKKKIIINIFDRKHIELTNHINRKYIINLPFNKNDNENTELNNIMNSIKSNKSSSSGGSNNSEIINDIKKLNITDFEGNENKLETYTGNIGMFTGFLKEYITFNSINSNNYYVICHSSVMTRYVNNLSNNEQNNFKKDNVPEKKFKFYNTEKKFKFYNNETIKITTDEHIEIKNSKNEGIYNNIKPKDIDKIDKKGNDNILCGKSGSVTGSEFAENVENFFSSKTSK